MKIVKFLIILTSTGFPRKNGAMRACWNASKKQMLKTVFALCLLGVISTALSAAELQGLVVDWKCAKQMVKDGREKTFRNNRSCSLMRKYNRTDYGLITDDKKIYRLHDPGNQHILQLLRNTPDKDDLKVVVTGDIDGDTVKVVNITML
jgi:hypothetical protein